MPVLRSSGTRPRRASGGSRAIRRALLGPARVGRGAAGDGIDADADEGDDVEGVGPEGAVDLGGGEEEERVALSAKEVRIEVLFAGERMGQPWRGASGCNRPERTCLQYGPAGGGERSAFQRI